MLFRSASSTSITAPLLGLGLSTTTNFGIACSDAQSQSVSAQCSIQTASPWITFITVPKSVPRGATATLGWITGGMSKCVVSSHDYANFTTQNAENTSPNGSVQTPSIDPSLSNVFWLTCTTVGGNVKEASSTITAL